MMPIRSLTCAVILAFLCVNYPYALDIISSDDLVWHHSDGPVVVWEVRSTNSAETRQFEHALPQNTGYQLLAVADLNADSHLDQLWYHPPTGNIVYWYYNGTTRMATHLLEYQLPASSNWHFAGVGDMDGDGNHDIVWHHQSSGSIAIWYMQGTTRLNTATIQNAPTIESGWRIRAINDFNADAHPDFLWHHDTGALVAWFMDNTSKMGHEVSELQLASSTGWSLYGTGKYNDDDHPDLLWYHAETGTLAFWFMDGITTQLGTASCSEKLPASTGWDLVRNTMPLKEPVAPTESTAGTGSEAVLQTTDLFWYDAQGAVEVWYTQNGERTGSDALPVGAQDSELIAISDMNADGHLDKVWYHPESGELTFTFLHGLESSASHKLAYALPRSTGWRFAGTADMDGDGNHDLIWHHDNAARIAIWYMDGIHRRDTALIKDTPSIADGWHVRAIDDFNQDGNADFVWHHNTGVITAWYMNNTTRLSYEALSTSMPVSSGWRLNGAADYNNDDMPDLVWYHAAQGKIAVWYMDGIAQVSTTLLTDQRDASTGWSLTHQFMQLKTEQSADTEQSQPQDSSSTGADVNLAVSPLVIEREGYITIDSDFPTVTCSATDADTLAVANVERNNSTVTIYKHNPDDGSWLRTHGLNYYNRHIHSIDIDGDTMAFGSTIPGTQPIQSQIHVLEYGFDWSLVAIFSHDNQMAPAGIGKKMVIDNGVIISGVAREDVKNATIHAGYSGAGYVMVYDNFNGAWQYRQKLEPSNGALYDYFGTSVDVEGKHIIVGAPEHDAGATNAGAAYLYAMDVNSHLWSQIKYFTKDSPLAQDAFGTAVSVHNDLVAVSACHNHFSFQTDTSSTTAVNSGSAVYVYAMGQGGSGQWGQVNILQPPAVPTSFTQEGDTWTAAVYEVDRGYGSNIELEGNFMLVTAWNPNWETLPDFKQSAYLYTKAGSSNSWSLLRHFNYESRDVLHSKNLKHPGYFANAAHLTGNRVSIAGYDYIQNYAVVDNTGNQLYGVLEGEYDRFGRGIAMDGYHAAIQGQEHIYMHAYDADGKWTLAQTLRNPYSRQAENQQLALQGDTLMIYEPHAYYSMTAYVKQSAAADSWSLNQALLPLGVTQHYDNIEARCREGGGFAFNGNTVAYAIEGTSANNSFYAVGIMALDEAGDWNIVGMVQPLDAHSASFGDRIALIDDVMAISQPAYNRVLMYQKTNNTWIYQKAILGGDDYGSRIAMQGDTLVVLRRSPVYTAVNTFAHFIHYYARNTGGANQWGLQQTLTLGTWRNDDLAKHAELSVADDYFAFTQSSPQDEANKVFIFYQDTDSTAWSWFNTLVADSGASYSTAVGIAGDQLIVASAFNNDYGYHAGSAYHYTLDSQSEQGDETHDAWTVVRATDTTYQPVASITPIFDLSTVGDVVFTQTPITDPNARLNDYPTAAELGPVGQLYTLRQHYVTVDIPERAGRSRQLQTTMTAIDGETMVVAARDTAGDWLDIYTKAQSGLGWTPIQRIFYAGRSIHSVDIDGDVIAFGATYLERTHFDRGAIFVLERNQDWGLVAILADNTGLAELDIGHSVVVDGSTIITGSSRDKVRTATADHTYQGAGYAMVYDKLEGQWQFRQKLVPSDGVPYDYFASSVDVDGDTLVIGAPGRDATHPDTGIAYVFSRDVAGYTWAQVKQLTLDDPLPHQAFGTAVNISGDTIVVTTCFQAPSLHLEPVADMPSTPNMDKESGAYLFERHTGGDEHWGLISSIHPEPTAYDYTFDGTTWTASDIVTDHWFGVRVKLDENLLLVQSNPHVNAAGQAVSGKAYLYIQDPSEQHWQLLRVFSFEGRDVLELTNNHFIHDEGYFPRNIDLSNNRLVITAYDLVHNYIVVNNKDNKLYARRAKEMTYFGKSISLQEQTAIIKGEKCYYVQELNDDGDWETAQTILDPYEGHREHVHMRHVDDVMVLFEPDGLPYELAIFRKQSEASDSWALSAELLPIGTRRLHDGAMIRSHSQGGFEFDGTTMAYAAYANEVQTSGYALHLFHAINLAAVPTTMPSNGHVLIAQLNDHYPHNILVRYLSPNESNRDYYFSKDANDALYNPNIITLLTYIDAAAETPWNDMALSTQEHDKIVHDSIVYTGHTQPVYGVGLLEESVTGADDWDIVDFIQPYDGMGHSFGDRIAISGNHMVITQPALNRVMLYQRNNGAWTYVQTITGSDDFGQRVAIHKNTLAVLRRTAVSDTPQTHEHAIALYQRAAHGAWEFLTTLDLGEAWRDDRSIIDAEIRMSANYLIFSKVSSRDTQQAHPNTVFIFARDATHAESWALFNTLVANDSVYNFAELAIWDNRFMVASTKDDAYGYDSGAVYFYELAPIDSDSDSAEAPAPAEEPLADTATTASPNDFIWHHQDGSLLLWEMEGTTRINTTTYTHALAPSSGYELIAFEDMNGDGSRDKVWYHAVSGKLAYWYLNGDKHSKTHLLDYALPASSGWRFAAIADLDGDGNNDFMWQHETAGMIAFWYMDGIMRLDTALIDNTPTIASGWHVRLVTDFNGDNRPDFLWRHVSGALVFWYMNNTTRLAHASSSASLPASSGWRLIKAGDYNADGNQDVVCYHAATGYIALWYMQGTHKIGDQLITNGYPAADGWSLVW